MNIRAQIVEEAQSYVGTPFQHQARLKGIGVDCVGLVIEVGRTVGLLPANYENTSYSKPQYPRKPDGTTLMRELTAHMQLINPIDARVGDVLVFWLNAKTRRPQHIAFVTNKGMLHTYANVGRVVEHRIDDKWKRRICAAFQFRGIE